MNRETNKKMGNFQQPNVNYMSNSNPMRQNSTPMNFGNLIAPFEQNEQFQNYSYQETSYKFGFQTANPNNNYNSNSFININNSNHDNNPNNNANFNMKLTPPGIQPMHNYNYKPNFNNSSLYIPNNNSNATSEDKDFNIDEIEAIEKQNEELKNEIFLLESQINAMKLDSNEKNTQKDHDNQSIKHKEVQTEDPQHSFFIEKQGKNSKIAMFLPTDSVTQDLHKEIIEFERIVTEIQREYKQKLIDFIPSFKATIQEITGIEPDVILIY